jgi:hypothetical protein
MNHIGFYFVHCQAAKIRPTKKINIMLYGAFTFDVKSVLNENLGGTQCEMDHSSILSEC